MVVGDQDDGPTLAVQIGQQVHDRRARAAVEVARRLVGEHDRRVGDEGAGDGDTLSFATRQGAWAMAAAVSEPDRVERRLGLCCTPVPRHAGVQQTVGDVVERGERLDEVELLEDETDAPPPHGGEPPVAHRAHIVAVDAHRAVRRALQGTDDVDQGRLPGPGRPDDHYEFASRDRQLDLEERVHRRVARITLRDAVQFQHRLAHGTTTCVPGSMSPLIATAPSANMPSSTGTRCVSRPSLPVVLRVPLGTSTA